MDGHLTLPTFLASATKWLSGEFLDTGQPGCLGCPARGVCPLHLDHHHLGLQKIGEFLGVSSSRSPKFLVSRLAPLWMILHFENLLKLSRQQAQIVKCMDKFSV